MNEFDVFVKVMGNNLRKARLSKGYRQVDMEELTGISYRRYQKIEAGQQNITIKTLHTLALVLGVKVADLVQE